MSCDNVITVQDLETDKKHSTFYREVITGKAGGTGADIDSATNAVTGQTQATLPKVLSNVGFSPAGFDFTTGGTLTERDKAIFYQADGNWYSWGGTLPKVVPPASSPASTGGIADNAWNVSTSAFMYRDWEGFTAELLSQAELPDNGQPDELGASQRVDAINAIGAKRYATTFKNEFGYSAVENMVAGRINGKAGVVAHKAGNVYSTGGTTWECKLDGATEIADFKPLGRLNVRDVGAIGDGLTDDYAAITYATRISSSLYFPSGTYTISQTWVTGNDKDILGENPKFTTIAPHASFPTGRVPLIALNPAFGDPENNAYNVSNVKLANLRLYGGMGNQSGTPPSSTVGTTGVDVTWTKDYIVLEDCIFEDLYEGITKTNSTRFDVVHWGIRISRCRFGSCYRGVYIYPSLGSIIDADIQTCTKGVVISGNTSSSMMNISGLRAEVNTGYTTPPGEGVLLELDSVKATVNGYFEGSQTHVKISGGANSQTVFSACTFSKANAGGVGGAGNGINIDGSGLTSYSSVTFNAIYGYVTGEAFMLLPGNPYCNINWLGQGGSGAPVFKNPDGSRGSFPQAEAFFNNDALRGGVRWGEAVVQHCLKTAGKITSSSGSGLGGEGQRDIKRIRNATLGTFDFLSIGPNCCGELRVHHAENTSTPDDMYQVWNFYTDSLGNLHVTKTVDVVVGTNVQLLSYRTSNGKGVFSTQVRQTNYDVLVVSIDVNYLNETDASITWL